MSRAVKGPGLRPKFAALCAENRCCERKTGGARKRPWHQIWRRSGKRGPRKLLFSIFTVVMGEAPPSSSPFSVAPAHPGLHSLGLVLVILFRKRDAPRNIREHTDVPRDGGIW